MKNNFKLFVVLTLGCILLLTSFTGCGEKKSSVIRVGGKNYTEQFIIAEMLGILIKENTDLDVSVQQNLVDNVMFDAIKANEIDVYMEYTGTGLIHLQEELLKDPKEVFELVKKEYDDRFNIKWMDPMGFNNTYAMVVTETTAEKYNLKTTSDLAKVGGELTLGSTYGFIERDDGVPGLTKTYGFKFKDVVGMDPSLMYQAVAQGDVDVISGFTTEGRIPSFGLVVLEDDKRFFPPYDASPIVRGEVLVKHPELEKVLNMLAGKINDNKMAELNSSVDIDKREPVDVAREFLKEEGLI